MKVLKISKDDLIIYSCLIGAIFCLGISTKEYLNSLGEESSVKTELQSAIKEVKGENDVIEDVLVEEPITLKDYDKSKILNEYFDNILDRIIVDNIISYDMLKSWEDYEILDFKYIKEIANNYYQYEVDIKINNKEASLPRGITEILNNDEYNIVSLNIYILENTKDGSFKTRKIEV